MLLLFICRCISEPERGVLHYVSRSPCGVAAIIVPWNLPIYLLTFKLAPALVHGNTVVAKPSEFTSLTAWMLCSVLKQAGEKIQWYISDLYFQNSFEETVTVSERSENAQVYFVWKREIFLDLAKKVFENKI